MAEILNACELEGIGTYCAGRFFPDDSQVRPEANKQFIDFITGLYKERKVHGVVLLKDSACIQNRVGLRPVIYTILERVDPLDLYLKPIREFLSRNHSTLIRQYVRIDHPIREQELYEAWLNRAHLTLIEAYVFRGSRT